MTDRASRDAATPTPEHIDGRRARRTRTRARIIAAAARLMADRGITGTTIDDMATAAGVAKGSVFYNFGSKDALARAVLEAGVGQLLEAMEVSRGDLTGWAALEAASLALLTEFDRSPDMGQIVATEIFRRERAWSPDMPQLRERLIAPLVTILGEVHEERLAAGITEADPTHEDFQSVAMSFLGALMFSAFDRRAFAADRDLVRTHASLMRTVSGLRG